MRRLARTTAQEMSPRQPLPAAGSSSFLTLPADLQMNVLRRLEVAGPDSPNRDARVLATSRLSEGSRAAQQAANMILNQNPRTCYIASAQRLRHAAKQPGPWGARAAAAIRDLDYVHLLLPDIGLQRRDDAMSMLQEHAPLSGLAVTADMGPHRVEEHTLAEILRIHKGSLKDLSLVLPRGFSEELTDAVAALGGLESLCLDNKNKKAPQTDDASARRLGRALGLLPNLRSLVVRDFRHATPLTACLPRLRHLQSLRISDYRAARQDWHAIAGNLQGLQAAGMAPLRHLELSSDHLTDEELAPLLPVLSGFRGLHELVLSGKHIGSVDMAALAGSLQGMRELKILDLAGNSLQGGGITSLARALEKLPQLKELRLERTHLAAADIGPLAAALQGSLRLQTLGLSFNRLGGCSAADWAALLGATGLESLRLSNCSLESPDVALLAAGLKACPTLKTLSLAGYDATATEVAQALAEGMACLPQLETCHLPVLGEDPLRVLLPTLQHLQGCSLKKVTLCPDDRGLVDGLRLELPHLKVDS